jgi:hypothetical protein
MDLDTFSNSIKFLQLPMLFVPEMLLYSEVPGKNGAADKRKAR